MAQSVFTVCIDGGTLLARMAYRLCLHASMRVRAGWLRSDNMAERTLCAQRCMNQSIRESIECQEEVPLPRPIACTQEGRGGAEHCTLSAGSLHGPPGSGVSEHLPAALLEGAAAEAGRAAAAALPGRPGDHQPHPRRPHRQEQARGELEPSSARTLPESIRGTPLTTRMTASSSQKSA